MLQQICSDMFVNIFLFLTFELFVETFLKDVKFSYKSKLRLIYFIITCIISIPNTLHFSSLIFAIICFSYVFFISNYQFITALKTTFLYFALFLFIFFITMLCYSLICNDTLTYSTDSLYFDYKSYTCIMFTQITINAIALHKLLKSKRVRTSFSSIFLLSTYLISFMMLFLNRLTFQEEGFNSIMPIIYLLLTCIIYISLLSYRKFVEMLLLQIDQQIKLQKYEYENTYYENIDTSLKSLSKIRHDFKNHLYALDTYASRNDMDSIKKYIHKINNEITESFLIHTSNDLLSSILNAKKIVCDKNNVTLTVKTDFNKIGFDDFHIITIFGNLLDNAITAASKRADGQISISIMQLDTYLEIICENNHCETIRKKDDDFASTKADKQNLHGFGIKNIQQATEELGGSLDIQYDDSIFTVKILIPNYH